MGDCIDFSSYIKKVVSTQDNRLLQSALALIKNLKWDMKWKTIDDGCAYACVDKVQRKETHYQIID